MATSAAMPHDADRPENNHHGPVESSERETLNHAPSTNGIASHQNHQRESAEGIIAAAEPVSVSAKVVSAAAVPVADAAVPHPDAPINSEPAPAPRQDIVESVTTTAAEISPQPPALDPEPLPIAVEERAPDSLRVVETVVPKEPTPPVVVQGSKPAPLEPVQFPPPTPEVEVPVVAPVTNGGENGAVETSVVETPVIETPTVETPAIVETVVETKMEVPDQVMEDAPPVTEPEPESEPGPVVEAPAVTLKLAREREDDDLDDAPDAKRARTEDEPTTATPTEGGPTTLSQAFGLETPVATDSTAAPMAPPAQPLPVTPPTLEELNATLDDVDFGNEVSEIQQKKMVEGMRNLKKNKSALPFLAPVDPVALNIPTYLDIVQTPMDLGTMEKKLKDKAYTSVKQYINDFNQMVANCYKFNGTAHAVSIQAGNLKAQFDKQLRTSIPKAGESAAEVQAKKPRRDSIPATTREAPRRTAAPRPSLGNATSPTSPIETFAMRDGIPVPRRQSSGVIDRPKREIVKPKSKDLPYSFKPRKKSQMPELKFAEHVVAEMQNDDHEDFSLVFQKPVDPVEQGLPTYNAIVKKPMDVSTISLKLSQNEYDTAEQVRADFKLMFKNCYDFNGVNSYITAMGKKYENLFDALWRQKKDWLGKDKKGADAQSAASDQETEESEEEEDEEDEDAKRQQKLAEISAQIAQLSAQAHAIVSAGNIKSDKKKSKATTTTTTATIKKSKKAGKEKPAKSRKSGSIGGANTAYPILKPKEKAKPKPKPKKKKPLNEKQKEELSEKVGQLGPEQMTEAARMIKEGFRKAGMHELANQPDDNLEFEINQIPEDTLVDLLAYARRMVPSQDVAHNSDGEYGSPQTQRNPAKQKKRKPMAKAEQAAQINALRGQIQRFEGGSASEGNSPEGNILQSREQDSSDDDEVSGSESEEE